MGLYPQPLRKRHLVWSLYEFIFWIKSVRVRFLYEIAREKEHWKNRSTMKFYSLILVKNKVWIRFIHEITREKSLLKVLFLFSLKWLDSNVYFFCVSFFLFFSREHHDLGNRMFKENLLQTSGEYASKQRE